MSPLPRYLYCGCADFLESRGVELPHAHPKITIGRVGSCITNRVMNQLQNKPTSCAVRKSRLKKSGCSVTRPQASAALNISLSTPNCSCELYII